MRDLVTNDNVVFSVAHPLNQNDPYDVEDDAVWRQKEV